MSEVQRDGEDTTTTGAVARPKPIKAVPLRHWGRWISAAVVLYLTAALLYSLAKNTNVDWPTIGEYLFKGLTLRGLVVTIYLTLIAMTIGFLGGTLLAVMRLSDNYVLSTIAYAYIWFFRGTPVLVQILIWGFLGALYPRLFLGIPFANLTFASAETSAAIGATTAAILALGLNEAAYAAEIIRSGLISVDKGQTEAAMSLGMSSGKTTRRIVLPQSMRVLIPPLGNETIGMLKTTALVSVISGNDLLTNLQIAYGQNFKIIPLLLVATIWYIVLTTILSIGQHYLERHFGKGFGADEGSRAERRGMKREATCAEV